MAQTKTRQQYRTIVNLFGCKQILVIAKLKWPALPQKFNNTFFTKKHISTIIIYCKYIIIL